MTAAPLAISLLGELIMNFSKSSVSLTEKTPTDGFKFLRHPDSIKACLGQLSNEGWTAFNEAHKNMHAIRSCSSIIQTDVNNIVTILENEHREEVKILPTFLKHVSEMTENCNDLAIRIEEKFLHVMYVTGELLESCTAVKETYEQRYKAIVVEIKIAKANEKEAMEAIKEMEQKCKKLEKEVDEAQIDYQHSKYYSSSFLFPSTRGVHDSSIAKEVLLDTRGRLDEAYNNIRAQKKRLGEIVSDIMKFSTDEMDFDTIQKTLKEGLKVLAHLREEWAKLVEFVQLVKLSFYMPLKNFVGLSSDLGVRNIRRRRDMIFKKAKKARHVCDKVQLLSNTYIEVSSRHLMSMVRKLNHLLQFNEILPHSNTVHNDLRPENISAAQKEIHSIVKKFCEEQQVTNTTSLLNENITFDALETLFLLEESSEESM